MSHCMVLWCKNKGPIPGISYFKLTKSRHDAWMKALGRNPNIERLSFSNLVCSDHFSEENKIYINKCVRLKPDAVPTLKLKKRDGLFENQKYINRTADQIAKEPVSIIVEDKYENLREHSSLSRKMENRENYPYVPVSSIPEIEICTKKGNSSLGNSITIKLVTTSQRFKRKLKTSSYDSSSSKGVIKKNLKRH